MEVNVWLWLSAITMTLTAAIHAVVGHRRLIGPLLELDAPILQEPLARMVLVYAWQLTSVLMVLTALTMIWPASPRGLVVIVGWAWFFAGIADAIWSKGKHIGWPPITVAGLLGLMGVYY